MKNKQKQLKIRKKKLKQFKIKGKLKYTYNNKDNWKYNCEKKVSLDNLIYRHKDPTADVKFNDVFNAHNLLGKIRKGEISLADVKIDQVVFESNIGKKKRKQKV